MFYMLNNNYNNLFVNKSDNQIFSMNEEEKNGKSLDLIIVKLKNE